MRRFDNPCTLKGHMSKTDRILICDTMTELADRTKAGNDCNQWGGSWIGGVSKDSAARLLQEGELSRVATSDKFLAKLEDKFQFETGRFRTIDAISGGLPNVAAFLAGSPLNMRRRQRVADDVGPLTIVADTASSGNIGAADLEKRGAAILALVRILSGLRPVTLYAGVCHGNSKQAADGLNAVFTRVETAPLDLARAAFILANPGAARGVGYGIACNEFGGEYGYIPWAFGDADLTRKYGPECFGRVFPGSEILYLPSVFATDKSIKEPEKWLMEQVAKYGGMDNQAAAA